MRNSIVLLCLLGLITLSGIQLNTSPNRNKIGLIGPGLICTKSISSLYLIWGERYNLCKAVPPLKANCSLRKSSLNISTNARLIIKSCSTIAKSVHGTNSFHAIMEALSIIIHQFQCQYSCLLSIGYSLYHPMPDVRNS